MMGSSFAVARARAVAQERQEAHRAEVLKHLPQWMCNQIAASPFKGCADVDALTILIEPYNKGLRSNAKYEKWQHNRGYIELWDNPELDTQLPAFQRQAVALLRTHLPLLVPGGTFQIIVWHQPAFHPQDWREAVALTLLNPEIFWDKEQAIRFTWDSLEATDGQIGR
jgi:hypothetical protein